MLKPARYTFGELERLPHGRDEHRQYVYDDERPTPPPPVPKATRPLRNDNAPEVRDGGRPVEQVDPATGDVVAVHKSKVQAMESLVESSGPAYSALGKAIKKGTLWQGFLWRKAKRPMSPPADQA